MTTLEKYFYDKGSLDYRDYLLEILYEMRESPEADFALRFIRETFPKATQSRVSV